MDGSIWIWIIGLNVLWVFVCHAQAEKKGYDTGTAIVCGLFFGLFAVLIYACLNTTEKKQKADWLKERQWEAELRGERLPEAEPSPTADPPVAQIEPTIQVRPGLSASTERALLAAQSNRMALIVLLILFGAVVASFAWLVLMPDREAQMALALQGGQSPPASGQPRKRGRIYEPAYDKNRVRYPVSDPRNPASENYIETTPGLITLQEYSLLGEGMSYARACEIIGASGQELSRTYTEGVPGVMDSLDTVSYSFAGSGDLGANAIIMFQNDRLVTKGQSGLR